MLNLNEARLLGRLAEDPQFSVTAGGREWMRCRVLTNHPYRDDHGSWQERVEGHIVATFDKYRIEHARQKLRKGCAVYVEGELRNSRREVNGQVEYFFANTSKASPLAMRFFSCAASASVFTRMWRAMALAIRISSNAAAIVGRAGE